MAQWQDLITHLESIPEGVYETLVGADYDNMTIFGEEYGENGVSWCVIFNWCMYHDQGLDAIVPKTDNVVDFTTWAQAKGQWSAYPSVSAWVNFDDGDHTEIVVSFDATNVTTKGGNTNNDGSAEGNGVYSHTRLRTDPSITGYFAPDFPDGICPTTADPHDYRLVPVYVPPAFPTGLAPNKSNPSAKPLQAALQVTGYLDKTIALADNYGAHTQASVAAFNTANHTNSTGVTYDPSIGPTGWKLLFTQAYA